MKKLIALYKTPDDIDAFLSRYQGGHLPLVAKIPGLISADVTRIDRTLAGPEAAFLICEMRFADADFGPALKSPQMAAASADVELFAKDLVTVMTASALEL
ncbi:EthD family reductase [Caulobacter sp. SSI4214]|uniref:EthD family reductase n=1 Tax=Caulobacter sp. SSI4214 TaxID=2575739 RepID=UPI00143C74F4|nr:EthD family reductase [Caulobacter sp. SSI4214]